MNDGLILMMLELPMTMRRSTRRWCLIFFPVTLPIWLLLIFVAAVGEMISAIVFGLLALWNQMGDEE